MGHEVRDGAFGGPSVSNESKEAVKHTTTIAIVSVMLLVACDPPAPPVVSKPAPSLDGEDRAIMKAVLDDFLKTEWDQSIQRSIPPVLTAVSFLVFDATLPVCEREERMSNCVWDS
jgi:hypothetical protein